MRQADEGRAIGEWVQRMLQAGSPQWSRGDHRVLINDPVPDLLTWDHSPGLPPGYVHGYRQSPRRDFLDSDQIADHWSLSRTSILHPSELPDWLRQGFAPEGGWDWGVGQRPEDHLWDPEYWFMRANDRRIPDDGYALTRPERLITGIDQLKNFEADAPRTNALWGEVEGLLADLHRRGLPFAADGTPVNYDDERGFHHRIMHEPRDLTNHLVFADWLADHGRSDDERFRRQVADWVQRRLGQDPAFRPSGWLDQNRPDPYDIRTAGGNVYAPSSQWVNFFEPSIAPWHTAAPAGPHWRVREARTMGSLTRNNPTLSLEANLGQSADPYAQLGDGNLGDFDEDAYWGTRGPYGFYLNPAELVATGAGSIDNANFGEDAIDWPTSLWSQVEDILRNRFDTGQRLSRYQWQT